MRKRGTVGDLKGAGVGDVTLRGLPASACTRLSVVLVLVLAIGPAGEAWGQAPAAVQPSAPKAVGPLIQKAPPGSRPPSSDPRDLSGVWWKGFTAVLLPIGGGPVPFQPKAKAIQEAYDEADRLGHPMSDAATQCLPHGVPRSMLAPYPIQIIQTPGQMTILHEASHNVRLIYMDVEHSRNLKPTFMGESVAHWEGDTLVIDTIGLNDQTMMDRGGSTHSDQLHVVERMRKISEGSQLEDVFTFEDPVTFTRPWSSRIVFEWRPDVKILEAVCEENNRDVPVTTSSTGTKQP